MKVVKNSLFLLSLELYPLAVGLFAKKVSSVVSIRNGKDVAYLTPTDFAEGSVKI